MDVAQADANYATVNVPFALGVTYENTFSTWREPRAGPSRPASSARRRSSPASASSASSTSAAPIDPETGEPVGLTLFGTFSRSSGSLQDPGDEKQLYRYITGGLLPTDGACSLPNPLESKICFVNISSPADMRFFQSSGPIDLPPGGSGTIVVAYIFAAPVAVGRLPGRRLRREAGGHQRRPHHPGRSRPDGQRGEQDRHHDGLSRQHQRPARAADGPTRPRCDPGRVPHRAGLAARARRRRPSRCSTTSSCCPSRPSGRSSSWCRATTR